MRHIWLFSRSIDLCILGVPVWATWAICFALPERVIENDLPLWVWAVFIVGIDVSHVWSTLFRTYLDREEFAHHRTLLLRTPLLAFVFFFCIASFSSLWFWRVMAYLALFHFVKQQYGFFALYRGRFKFSPPRKIFGDTSVIYLATLYPVVYWHLAIDRSFDWFISGDFFSLHDLVGTGAESVGWLGLVGNFLYWIIIAAWCIEEIYLCRRHGVEIPMGKILWLLTTAGNWYLGIIHFNSDIVFSLTNVIAHGVPYIALIFFYVEKKKGIQVPDRSAAPLPLGGHLIFMLGTILLLAFGEEYLWDMLLYREHGALFEGLFTYPLRVLQTPLGQAVALAALSVPQVTHYILDGFIWKDNQKNPYLRQIFAREKISGK
ncbi:MAG: hypothetical protein ACI8PG_004522 [Planctomycetota bacterium]|jgi:hypothetical protein